MGDNGKSSGFEPLLFVGCGDGRCMVVRTGGHPGGRPLQVYIILCRGTPVCATGAGTTDEA